MINFFHPLIFLKIFNTFDLKAIMVRKATQKHGKGRSRRQHEYKVVNTKGVRTIDQIQTSIITGKPLPELDNLPGDGQFTCQLCDVFFRDQKTLDDHFKTKAHKRRCKEIKEHCHTSKDAEMAAGLY